MFCLKWQFGSWSVVTAKGGNLNFFSLQKGLNLGGLESIWADTSLNRMNNI